MFRIAATLVILLASGCATVPPNTPPSVTVHSVTDLAAVEAAAASLARIHGENQVLVAFDLDNTLLTMRTDLGADQWYEWQSRRSREAPCAADVVADRLAVQGALFHLGAMQSTEPGIPDRVERLQQAGHPVMLVTARGADFRLPTFRELRRQGLSFRATAPGGAGSGERFSLPGASRDVLYEDGALMLAGQHKGDMLLALYDSRDLPRPAAVVFADDKDKNIAAMHEALEREGIPGRLFRYDRLMPRVERFDAAAAKSAWNELRPAILTVQSVMGTDNFDVSQQANQACTP